MNPIPTRAEQLGSTPKDAKRRLAIVLIAVAPFLVVIVTRAGRAYFPAQDLAVIDLRARDLWSLHPPLTGPWSRVGFAHPGPLFYWLLGIPSALTGGAAWSEIVGAALLQAGAIVASIRLAWRRGGLAFTLLISAMFGLAYLAIRAWGLIAPWNIYVAFPYYPLFLLLAWSVALGEVHRIPWLAVVGTFLVQTHVGYLILVALPVLWVGGHLVGDARSGRLPRQSLRRPLAWTIGWMALLWTPVLVDELFVTGNLGAVYHYLTDSNAPKAGLSTSLGWLAEEFHLLPPWLGGPSRNTVFSFWAVGSSIAWLGIPAALFAIAVVALRRRRSISRRRLVELVGFVTVSALIAMSQITGDQFGYLFEWRIFVAILVVVACAWSVAPWIREHPTIWSAAGALLVGTVMATSAVLAYRVATFPDNLEPSDALLEPMVNRLVRQAPRSGHLLVRADGSTRVGVASTLVNELDRHGIRAGIDPWLDFEYGPGRRLSARDASEIWIVAEEGWQASRLRAIPGGRELASSHALSDHDERELSRIQRTLWHQLRIARADARIAALDNPFFAMIVARQRGIDHQLAERASVLDAKASRAAVCRCVVIGFESTPATRRRLRRLESPPPVRRKRPATPSARHPRDTTNR